MRPASPGAGSVCADDRDRPPGRQGTPRQDAARLREVDWRGGWGPEGRPRLVSAAVHGRSHARQAIRRRRDRGPPHRLAHDAAHHGPGDGPRRRVRDAHLRGRAHEGRPLARGDAHLRPRRRAPGRDHDGDHRVRRRRRQAAGRRPRSGRHGRRLPGRLLLDDQPHDVRPRRRRLDPGRAPRDGLRHPRGPRRGHGRDGGHERRGGRRPLRHRPQGHPRAAARTAAREPAVRVHGAAPSAARSPRRRSSTRSRTSCARSRKRAG